ncbi:FAD-binding oxidoreductase [Streptomyces scopuliridis]|uniref:FAD-binding oxidoreductase n=1 Tax=Streptomyces scopuliridis TaxID=452529 RepID=A0ACD4ZDY2_9ACTN|nr:styrene monooxygenase/indole monooxygenase family protein [Streptomyces scopuliridis]WSB32161.1 FAD-binding oxidoreductase [Streptomyces scopuliridis]WSB96418.1 FAD-binding oxidoreductase [Streptomyces scopuliridis]WSC09877.1 FAD-binding oxidoreductase [Streptomyces scopuliridis]
MREIAIVGAGQAGLQLALGLLARGYDVTVITARDARRIRAGRVMSTQAMFGPALRIEREAGLNLWQRQAPVVRAIRATVTDGPGAEALAFTGPLDEPQQSVDQRVKMAGWLELFEARGGRVIHRAIDATELERIASERDLTLVAAGRGELAEIFARDSRQPRFGRPLRTLSCVYLHGVRTPGSPARTEVRIHVVPGVGEVFLQPALTTSGPCTTLLWEAVPGGPLDCWQDRPSPQDHLTRSLDLLRAFLPQEYELCAAAEPTDANATLYGAVTPTVRHPVARLSPDTHMLGMADVVVVNDPVTGQGANNAARCADIYLDAILEQGEGPFDPAWMRRTFDVFWDHARHTTAFTSMMLEPLPEHMLRVLSAAVSHEAVARRFANVYADPSDFANWLADPAATDAYLASATGS